MARIDTPWGAVRVEDAIDTDLACERCGTCCRAFYLSVTPPELDRWYARFLEGSADHYPPDIGAVYHLFVPFPGFTPPEGQIYTCRAFDPEGRRCTLLPDAPDLRPVACFAFPYVYDVASLWEFPYPECGIYRRALRRLNADLLARVWERCSPFGDMARD